MESFDEILENDSLVFDELEIQDNIVDAAYGLKGGVRVTAAESEAGGDCETGPGGPEPEKDVNPNIVCQFDGNQPCCSKSLLKRKLGEEMDLEEDVDNDNSKYLKGENGSHVPVNLQTDEHEPEIEKPASDSSAICQKEAKSTADVLELVSNFTNFNGCKLEQYGSLSTPFKSLVFEVQRETAELFKNFGRKKGSKNQNPPGGIKPASVKLQQLLHKWKSLVFEHNNVTDFLITSEMEMANSSCVEVLNSSDVEFFKLIQAVVPLVELLYLIRIGNALCLTNFVLGDDLNDDFGSMDE